MKKVSIVHKLICAVLANALVFVGCVGSDPNPVQRYNTGDENRACTSLISEMGDIDQAISTREERIGDRDFWNTIFFVGGFFTIVTFFLMDTHKAEETEIAAYKSRRSGLKAIANEKNCAIVESGSDQ